MFRTVNGQEEQLTLLRAHSHFGERALLRDSPSEFSVRVSSDTEARLLVQRSSENISSNQTYKNQSRGIYE